MGNLVSRQPLSGKKKVEALFVLLKVKALLVILVLTRNHNGVSLSLRCHTCNLCLRMPACISLYAVSHVLFVSAWHLLVAKTTTLNRDWLLVPSCYRVPLSQCAYYFHFILQEEVQTAVVGKAASCLGNFTHSQRPSFGWCVHVCTSWLVVCQEPSLERLCCASKISQDLFSFGRYVLNSHRGSKPIALITVSSCLVSCLNMFTSAHVTALGIWVADHLTITITATNAITIDHHRDRPLSQS